MEEQYDFFSTESLARNRFFPGWQKYMRSDDVPDNQKPWYRVRCNSPEEAEWAEHVKPAFIKAEIVIVVARLHGIIDQIRGGLVYARLIDHSKEPEETNFGIIPVEDFPGNKRAHSISITTADDKPLYGTEISTQPTSFPEEGDHFCCDIINNKGQIEILLSRPRTYPLIPADEQMAIAASVKDSLGGDDVADDAF